LVAVSRPTTIRHKGQERAKRTKLSHKAKGRKMKKFAVISLVIIMLVVSVVPAFAKGGVPAGNGNSSGAMPMGNAPAYGSTATGNGPAYGSSTGGTQVSFGVRTPYALSGTISALDAEARTVTVAVVCGNRLAVPFISEEVTLQAGEATRFLLRIEDGSATSITFADLEIGQNVSSHGSLVDGTWTATRVTVDALLQCLP
jgi:hypothetical protein